MSVSRSSSGGFSNAATRTLFSLSMEVPAYTRYSVPLKVETYSRGYEGPSGSQIGSYVYSMGTDPDNVPGTYYTVGNNPSKYKIAGSHISNWVGKSSVSDSKQNTFYFQNSTGKTQTVTYYFYAGVCSIKFNRWMCYGTIGYARLTVTETPTMQRLVPTSYDVEYDQLRHSLEEEYYEAIRLDENYPTEGVRVTSGYTGGWNGMANCIDPGTYTVSQEISSDEAYSNYVFYDRETQTVLMETYQEQDVDADGNPVVDADGNPVMVDKERPIRNHQITILIRPKRLDLNTLKWDYDPEAPPQYNYNEQQMKLTDDCVPEWLTPIYVGAGTNVGNYNTTVSFTENMEYIQSYLGSYELANWREYFVVPDLDESPAEATTFYCEEGEVEDWVSLDWILAPKRILAEWDTTHTTAKYGSHNDVTDLPFMVGDKLVTESTKYTLEYGSDMPALNTDIQGRVEYRFYDRFGYNQGVNTPYFTLDQFIENRAQLAVDPTLYYVMAYVTDENFVL